MEDVISKISSPGAGEHFAASFSAALRMPPIPTEPEMFAWPPTAPPEPALWTLGGSTDLPKLSPESEQEPERFHLKKGHAQNHANSAVILRRG